MSQPDRRISTGWAQFGLILLWIAPGAAAAMPRVEYHLLPELLKERSPSVRAGQLAVEAASARTGSLRESFLPQVAAQAGIEAFRTGSFDAETQPFGAIEASLNLYRGGRDSLEEQKRVAEAALSRAASDKQFRQELLLTRGLFWDLAFERELAIALEKSLGLVASGKAAAERRAARGLTTRTDGDFFTLYSRQLRERLEGARREEALALVRLRARLSLDASVAVETPAELLEHAHDEKLFSESLANSVIGNPEARGAAEEARSFELAGRQLSRWWTPSVEVYGAYSLYTLRERAFPVLQDRVDVAGGLRLRLNLFDGLQSAREARSLNLRALALEKEVSARQQAISSEAEATQGQLRRLHELIHGSEETLALGERLLSQTIAEYDRGVRGSQDVLSGIERLVSLRELNLTRLRDYQKVKAKLLSLLGE
ncbi:MAG: TolC family protein [Oligoflexia bacterium]|nr:TolC family protein [Oligoflexia bacterium]